MVNSGRRIFSGFSTVEQIFARNEKRGPFQTVAFPRLFRPMMRFLRSLFTPEDLYFILFLFSRDPRKLI